MRALFMGWFFCLECRIGNCRDDAIECGGKDKRIVEKAWKWEVFGCSPSWLVYWICLILYAWLTVFQGIQQMKHMFPS